MNKLQEYITERVPGPIKLIFFFGLAFSAGYVVGDYGYKNLEIVAENVCYLYYPQ